MRGLVVLLFAACSGHAASPSTSCTTDCESRCTNGDGAACAAAAETAFNGWNGAAMDLAKSFAMSSKACDLGDGLGCMFLGLHYQDGRGAPWDHAKAIAAYEKSCSLGTGTGCFNLESMYSGGHGAVVDHAKADALHAKARTAWETACKGSAPRWCTNFAFAIMTDGEVTNAKREQARGFDQRACDAGVLVGCTQVARLDSELGTLDAKAYAARIEELCGKGEGGACGQLGLDLFLGEHGIAKDVAHASEMLHRGCAAGDAQSCYDAGLAGLEQVAKNPDAILRDFTAACDRGYGRGCLRVMGDLGKRSDPNALQFAERACQIGEKEGCSIAAEVYLTGNGAPRDPDKGMRWAREACSMGDGETCVAVIAAGIDPPVPPDVKPKLFADACTAGVKSACTH